MQPNPRQNFGSKYSGQEIAERATKLIGKEFTAGCSGLVCEALGIPWKSANTLMGSNPQYLGKGANYSGLKPGDVVGWKRTDKSGHVAIYVGIPGCVFVHSRDENQPGKCSLHFGNDQDLYLAKP